MATMSLNDHIDITLVQEDRVEETPAAPYADMVVPEWHHTLMIPVQGKILLLSFLLQSMIDSGEGENCNV